MGALARLFGIAVTITALILPSWGQDAKKEAKDDQPKPIKKTTDKKKDKSKSKNKSKKTKKESSPQSKEKVDYGQVFTGQLKEISGNSQRDFSVTLMLPDPKKIFDLNVWMQQNIVAYQAQQLLSQQQQLFNIARQTNVVSRAQATAQYNQSLAQYNLTMTQRQIELAQRETQIYSPKDVELRASEKIKVRTAAPPTEFDDKGNMKVWTEKELKKIKKGSSLPGYPAQFDALRPTQMLAVYLAKPVFADVKSSKKGIKIEEKTENLDNRPEVVMLVIIQEPMPANR